MVNNILLCKIPMVRLRFSVDFIYMQGILLIFALFIVQCAQNSAAFFSAYACNTGENLVVFLKKERNLVYFAQRIVHTYLPGV